MPDLTPRQLDVLAAYRDGCQSIREVASRLGLSHVTILEHAQALARAGALVRSGRAYVVADRCPTCRRSWRPSKAPTPQVASGGP